MGLLEACTSPACAYGCGLLSAFGIVFMGILGVLLNNDYRYVGEEWKVPGMDHKQAAANCFLTALVYAGFLGLSLVCCCANAAKKRR